MRYRFQKTSRPHYSPKKLRNALKTAKEKQVGFWDKTEQVTIPLRTVVVNFKHVYRFLSLKVEVEVKKQRQQFSGIVTYIQDCLLTLRIKLDNGSIEQIFLDSKKVSKVSRPTIKKKSIEWSSSESISTRSNLKGPSHLNPFHLPLPSNPSKKKTSISLTF